MNEVDIDDVRENLSLLIDKAVRGESFLITRFGKALVRVEAVACALTDPLPRLGFMAGQFTIPEDFDASDSQIEKLFYGEK